MFRPLPWYSTSSLALSQSNFKVGSSERATWAAFFCAPGLTCTTRAGGGAIGEDDTVDEVAPTDEVSPELNNIRPMSKTASTVSAMAAITFVRLSFPIFTLITLILIDYYVLVAFK
jgi:hypothetical protein